MNDVGRGQVHKEGKNKIAPKKGEYERKRNRHPSDCTDKREPVVGATAA